MMAKAHEDITRVVFRENIYELAYIPSEDSQIVKEKVKCIEDQLNLMKFGSEDILKLGHLVQLAYFGVVGHTGLQIKIRPALIVVSDLCDDITHTLNGLKRCLHNALIQIQTFYEYLENSCETSALLILKNLQLLSQKSLDNLDSLSQKCWKEAESLLKVHHIAEKEKKTAKDEAQKQKKELSNAKKGMHICKIWIKKSNGSILKEKCRNIGFDKKKTKITEAREKLEKKCEKDVQNANKKYLEKLCTLKSKYDNSDGKKIKKGTKKQQKKLDTLEIDKNEKTLVAYMKSTAGKGSKSDDKLLKENKQHHLLANKSYSSTENQICKDHQSTQTNNDEGTSGHISHNTVIVDASYANSEVHTVNCSEPCTSVETQNLQYTHVREACIDTTEDEECTLIDKATSQVEKCDDVKVVPKQVIEKQKMVNDAKARVSSQENEGHSTAITGDAVKGKEKAFEEQEEALLKDYNDNVQQLEQKCQNETKKLNEELEKLNEQTTSKNVIEDNEQKIKEHTLMDKTTISQVELCENAKVVSKKVTKEQNDTIAPVNNQENAVDSTTITRNGVKRKEKTFEEQQEALSKENTDNVLQIKQKCQNEIIKLNEELEKLNKQITTSEKVIKDNEQKIEDNEQKFSELSKSIVEMAKANDLNDTIIECICHALTALYTIGSIMRKLGNFLRDFTAALCCQLNDPTLTTQIEFLQRKNDIWKSIPFKLTMLDCYGNYVAFTNACNTAVEYITKAQEEVYHNVCKNLTRDEALKLVQENPPSVIELD